MKLKEQIKQAQRTARRLAKLSVKVKRQPTGEQLETPVLLDHVCDKLFKQHNVKLLPSQFLNFNPINDFGSWPLKVHLVEGVVATITVDVIPR